MKIMLNWKQWIELKINENKTELKTNENNAD